MIFSRNIKTAVLIDSEDDQTNSFSPHLKKFGFTTKIANKGSIALQIIYAFRPILIICESDIKDIDPILICKAVRNFSEQYDPFMVILNSCNDHKAMSSSVDAGFDMYAVKPVNIDRVMLIAETSISSRHI